uniref:39S ribosomal protein L55, mitochondrial n=1 Tax=Mesocestoides corti TaxID=53468 RepID=A0A5K3FAS7_MESCO
MSAIVAAAHRMSMLHYPLRIPQCFSSTRVCITRVNRKLYGRFYPVHLVLANGATIRLRYKEPRCLLQLPLDLNECDEEERARRLQRRKPRARLALQDESEFADTFDPTAYDFLWAGPKSNKPPAN